MEEESTAGINTETETEIKIKHIVCSGGGLIGFSFYGVIREAHKKGLWKLEDIESMYGTSVGSIFSVLLSLNYDWETMDSFLIRRPWQNVFKFNMYSVLESFTKRGIFDIQTITDMLAPAFHGKDIPMNITMKEFYELTKIEIHIFATDLTKFEMVDISYKTHPEWKVVDAVYCSSSVPIIFSPHLIEDKCYCDGGLILNYPINVCLENEANPDEILGLNLAAFSDNDIIKIDKESSLLDYAIMLFNRLIKVVLKSNSSIHVTPIKHEFILKNPPLSIYDILNATSNIEERHRLINEGVNLVNSRYP